MGKQSASQRFHNQSAAGQRRGIALLRQNMRDRDYAKKPEGANLMRWNKKFFAACIVTAMTFVCSPCIGAADNNTDVPAWNWYANEENHFSFAYPKDWEVIDEGFYKTHYGLTIQRIGRHEDADNCIRINSPQFSVEDGRCITVDDQQICTYSKDAAVIDIFRKITAGFSFEQE